MLRKFKLKKFFAKKDSRKEGTSTKANTPESLDTVKKSDTLKSDYKLDEDDRLDEDDNLKLDDAVDEDDPPKEDGLQNEEDTLKKADPSPAWRTAKASLVFTLELAEKALDGLPIPGAKGSIGAVLRVIKKIDTSDGNAETLQILQKQVEFFCHDALEPISKLKEEDVPSDLKTDIEKLGSDLEDLAKVWTNRASRGAVRRFVDADKDQEELKDFADGIKLAVERFTFNSNISGRLAAARQEKTLTRIESHVVKNQEIEVTRERSRLVESLPRAHRAGYDSGRAGGPSSCFSGTRTAILDTIKAWVENVDVNLPRVFWLNGLAGIGKSTIAKTIAEYAHTRGILGGSFFFSRDDQDLRDPDLVFPTLAWQLARWDSTFKSSIGAALEEDSGYGYRSAPTQLDKLIVGPLSAAGRSDRIVLLVLDALDECGSRDGESDAPGLHPSERAAEILRLLLAHAIRVPFHLRVLLTSRPEHHIRSVFNQEYNHAKYILHDIEASVVRHDIHLFVRGNLLDIPKKFPGKTMPGDWPRETDIEALVEKSGKLFVYAATALRFVGNVNARNPQRQLEILLGVRQATNSTPYAYLDQLYLAVLRNALPLTTEEDDIARFHWVVGTIVVMRDPLSMAALAQFTKRDSEDVVDALYHLHSIILTPETFEEAPRLYHQSFPDFITDPKRCQDERLIVTVPKQEIRLVLRCLELMMGALKRDVAGVGNPSLLNSEVEGLTEKLTEVFPPELRYAFRHWPSHLLGVTHGDTDVVARLDEFASRYLLNWIEAMSLLGAIPLTVSSMRDVHQWAVRSDCEAHLTNMLYDCYRFVLSNQDAITANALHVYRTALPFTPRDTLLYKTYEADATDAARVLHGLEPCWSPCLHTTHCRGNSVKSIAHSPDGSRVAYGLRNDTVGVWDAVSNSIVHSLKHPGSIRSVRFSVDGAYLASASSMGDIRIWDVLSGILVRSFQKNSAPINCISISPKSPRLASGSTDATVKIWDFASGLCVTTLACNSSSVFSVAYLLDGIQLLSGSEDGIIRLWDTVEGIVLREFEHHSAAVRAISVSPDGVRIASGSDDHTVKVFDTAPGSSVMTFDGHKNKVTTVVFSPDGLRLASTGEEETNLYLWDSTSGEILRTFLGWANGLSFLPDGILLASAHDDVTSKLWDTQTPPPDVDRYAHHGWIHSVTFSSDGMLLATGGDSKESLVKVWDVIWGTHVRTLSGHSWAIYSLAFSRDNTQVASGSGDTTVRVWDIKSGEQLHILGHDNYVNGVSFVEGSSRIITRTPEQTFLWDVDQPEEPLRCTDEANAQPSAGMGGRSKGYEYWMDGDRWLWMASMKTRETMRIVHIYDVYRIGGFAVHSDRVVFTSIYGELLILDVSSLKKQFRT